MDKNTEEIIKEAIELAEWTIKAGFATGSWQVWVEKAKRKLKEKSG